MQSRIEYDEYLQSLHWFNLREETIRRAGHQCECCGRKNGGHLDGHHLNYRNPLTDCTPDDIMALCRSCHDLWHDWQKGNGVRHGKFGRAETLGALAVLRTVALTPVIVIEKPVRAKEVKPKHEKRAPAPGKPNTNGNEAAILRGQMMHDPTFVFYLEKLPRKLFLKFCKKHFKGHKRPGRYMANAAILFDHPHLRNLGPKPQPSPSYVAAVAASFNATAPKYDQDRRNHPF